MQNIFIFVLADYMNIETTILSIEERITRLINLYRIANQENKLLTNENKQLKQTLEEQDKTIKEQQQRLQIINITNTIATKEEAEIMKRKISEMVREIDKCIQDLSKQ